MKLGRGLNPVTDILIREPVKTDTQREGSHVMVEVESGTMQQGTPEFDAAPQAGKRQERILPQSPLGECGPVVNLISDFWPANLRENTFPLP